MALTGSVRIMPDTKYHPHDFDGRRYGTSDRVVGIGFDGLTLAIGLSNDDERIAAIDRLMDVLAQLRNDAADRMAAFDPEAVAS